jgi:hypothetical protein
VTAVRCDQDVIPGLQDPWLGLVFEAQAGAASQHDHPLAGVLVVPLAGRGDVAGRDDALQPKVRGLEHHVDELIGERSRQGREEILCVQGRARCRRLRR